MKEAHIISLLEGGPVTGLGDEELAAVRAHAAGCAPCRRAFEAAQISALLLKERAAQEVEPPPFFQTRVLAALRERQSSPESAAWSLRRLWKAAGALVSGMAATVAALAVFTFVAPQPEAAPQEVSSALGAYTAEEVILSPERAAADALTYDQVLAAVYETGEEAER